MGNLPGEGYGPTVPAASSRIDRLEEDRLELLLPLDRDLPQPLRAQLAGGLREGIREGRLADGLRLPSTRQLAETLGVSRGVVEDAYAQLAAEGYIVQPDRARPTVKAGAATTPRTPAAASPRWRHDLSATTPDLAFFPRSAWASATRHVLRTTPDAALGYGHPAGPPAFREALVARLARLRGTNTSPAEVLATSGFTQSLDLVARTLHRLGARRVAVEDPGFDEQCLTLRACGLDVVPVPVDGEGVRADIVAGLDPDAVLVTPAHQFPTGAVLSPARRRELVSWARTHDRLILEDDYDAEYRYDRRPVGALQGLAPDHVVSLGTTSKTLAPTLRIGWLVLPSRLVAEVTRTRYAADAVPGALPLLAYAALAESGALDRHLRRTRRQYASRRDALLNGLAGRRVSGAAAGLHLVLELDDGVDAAVAELLARDRVHVRTLASYTLDERNRRAALVVGYGRLGEAEIPQALEILGAAIARATCDLSGCLPDGHQSEEIPHAQSIPRPHTPAERGAPRPR